MHTPRPRRHVRLLLPLVAAGVALLLAACEDAPEAAIRLSAPPEGDAELGRQALRHYGCASCHVIPGVSGADGHVGPPLTHLARREYVAGMLLNSPENLRLWIIDPPSINPATAMPPTGVTDEDVWHIIAYLATLD